MSVASGAGNKARGEDKNSVYSSMHARYNSGTIHGRHRGLKRGRGAEGPELDAVYGIIGRDVTWSSIRLKKALKPQLKRARANKDSLKLLTAGSVFSVTFAECSISRWLDCHYQL